MKYGVEHSPFGYGERKKHPLYETWRFQARIKEGRCKEWEDFWQFVSDVGERPTDKHKAKRHKIAEAWSRLNFYWKETTKSTENHAEYQKDWRSKNPIKAKGYDLKRAFGLSMDEYLAMYADQKGRCAICNVEKSSYTQTKTIAGDGGKDTMVVDHCHKSGKVRKLLCHQCNKALGGFQDSPEVLKAALRYLKQNS